ncbi:MAG: hydroxymethylglutaryl-CoA reductase, degradative [Fervidicoccaceae archaeon]
MREKSSRLPRFYEIPLEKRLELIAEIAELSNEERALLSSWGNLDPKLADVMIENVIGAMSLPLAIATNFRVNDRDYLVPMVIEEPSVVAAASHAAKLMREGRGIISVASDPIMIGQVMLIDVDAPTLACAAVLERRGEILSLANSTNETLLKLGGGAKDLECRSLETRRGPAVAVHLLVDVRDAMGANTVNAMAETVAPLLEEITGGKARLKIVSNLADRRIVRSRAVVKKEALGGEEVVDAIVDAWALADADPYRAATHNKGIMNGVIAVALATCQDHRAIEAGAHAYAARTGRYRPLSTWWKTRAGDLAGVLEMPVQVGTVGGAVRSHPVARIALKILGVSGARELAEVMGAVGLAQNLAALRALVTEGIQRGHMRLHARNLAIMAGATPEEAEEVARSLEGGGPVTLERVTRALEDLRRRRSEGHSPKQKD